MKRYLSCLLLISSLLGQVLAEAPKFSNSPETAPLSANASSHQEEPKFDDPRLYIQFDEALDGSATLKTSAISFKNDQNVEVDLIGVIHVGEKSYYEKLDQSFKAYESLLFEMIGGQTGMTLDELRNKSGRFNVVRSLQQGITKALNLQFQLDHIDYSAPNFVHADMSAEGFKEAQDKRGESFLKLFLKSYQTESSLKPDDFKPPQGGVKDPSVLDLLHLAAQGKAGDPLKRLMGRLLQKMDEGTQMLGNGKESAILTDRNAVAFEVLDQQIKEGKRKLGVFYGAAHLPDMVTRLLDRGFKYQGIVWHTAWVVPPATDGTSGSSESPAPTP